MFSKSQYISHSTSVRKEEEKSSGDDVWEKDNVKQV
jgi:hypothetical protein